jgi:hypothetical protein
MYRYYPSCVFRTIDAQADDCLTQYAKAQMMEIAGCCRFDHKKTEAQDRSLYVCQACRTNISAIGNTPESLWLYLDQDTSFVFPDYHGMKMTLQDCWRYRDHTEIHDAVRSLLAKMNIEVAELPANRTKADFCGRFHCTTERYTELRKQYDPDIHLDHLPDHLYEKIMHEHVQQYPTEYVICYCNTCYKGIQTGGGHPIHLAQLLFQTVNLSQK